MRLFCNSNILCLALRAICQMISVSQKGGWDCTLSCMFFLCRQMHFTLHTEKCIFYANYCHTALQIMNLSFNLPTPHIFFSGNLGELQDFLCFSICILYFSIPVYIPDIFAHPEKKVAHPAIRIADFAPDFAHKCG